MSQSLYLGPEGQEPQPHPSGQRARLLERLIAEQSSAQHNTSRAPDNERLAASLHQQSFGQGHHIDFGKVLWATPYLNSYRVALDNAGGELICCALSETASLPLSTRSTSPIPAGASVLVWHTLTAPFGVILGVLPPMAVSGGSNWPDWISQGSNGGYRRERYHRQLLEYFSNEGGQRDFSSWRPCDASAIGEWGRFDDLGGGLFISPLEKFFRVNEVCGLWLFYQDCLAQLFGHNFDFVSHASEQQIRHDEGETADYHGRAAYPWEALGAWQFGETVHREIDSHAVHYEEPYGKCEPLHDDQQPYFRLEEYHGYLGQAFLRSLSAPPIGATGVNRTIDTQVRPGLFREQLGLDGHYAVASAHSLSFMKRVGITVPKRIKATEDPTGDDATSGGYKFAGRHGDGPEHKVTAKPTTAGEHGYLLSAAGIMDVAAHVFNWKGMHPFHYHVKDFHTPQPSELAPFTTLQQLPNFSELQSQPWLSPPSPQQVAIDGRYGSVDYYENTAGLFITPEGHVVLRDGAGSEFRMAGGEITIAPAGDVSLRPGRNCNVLAGHDVILKAHNSIDLSATKHDIRCKAERHFEVLAGNNGETGRVLLQCQASAISHDVVGKKGEEVGETGIIFKAANSEIAGLASNIYLRTGGGDLGNGTIVIDAGLGQQDVHILGAAIHQHCEASVISVPAAEKTLVHRFGREVHLGTSLAVDSGLLVRRNGIRVNGDIIGVNCTVASDRNTGGLLAQHRRGDSSWDATYEVLDRLRQTLTELVRLAQADYTTNIAERWLGDKQLGNAAVITNIHFAPRTIAQLRTQNFKLAEVYYQTLARAGSGLPGWSEKVIRYQGEEFMPYPGKAKWADEPCFLRVEHTLHDPQTGQDRDRGEVYENPQLGPWTPAKLDGIYPVIIS